MVIAKTLGELGFLDLITFFNAFGEPSVTLSVKYITALVYHGLD